MMTGKSALSKLLNVALTNKGKHQIDPFVADFLAIWASIQQQAKNIAFDDLLPLCRKILNEQVLPFYHKYAGDPVLKRVPATEKRYASILINWNKRGLYYLPLHLLLYEYFYHQKKLLWLYLQKLRTNEMKGTKDALFNFLLPTLTNFVVPLDPVDIDILKSILWLEHNGGKLFGDFSKTEIGTFVRTSQKTITRRWAKLDLLQIMGVLYFLDMGQLGYETFLLFHTNDFPEEFRPYLLMSSRMQLGIFSLVQIPFQKTSTLHQLQDQLESLVSYPMLRRISNWNLTGFIGGEDPWQVAPSLVYNDPQINLITPTPRLDLSLPPEFDPIPLTPADIRILDFISSEGGSASLTEFSQIIDVSVPHLSAALKRYSQQDLIIRMTQFFSIGLDISCYFFLSIKGDSIPWVDHFLAFPKVDLFIHEQASTSAYFGYLKLPLKWIKPFARNLAVIVNEQRQADMKFYWQLISPVDHFKWSLSLSETFSQEGLS
ncbi:MAG: hypothetical protein ACFFFG_11860 [Candidatus Thorarchaeota archaeon]